MLFRRSTNRGGAQRQRNGGREHLLMVDARSRSGRKEKLRKMGIALLFLCTLCGTVWATVAGAHLLHEYVFEKNDFFTITKLDLQSSGRLLPTHIQEYGHLAEGMNLFDVDLAKLKKDLEDIPVIKSAEVRRRLPDTLIVRVVERTAVAKIGGDKSVFHLAVDQEGYVLGPTARSPELPVISGVRMSGLAPGTQIEDPMITDALMAINMCETTPLGETVCIAGIDVGHEEYLKLRLASGEHVLISRTNLRGKLDELAYMLQIAAEKGKTLASVDLTIDVNVPTLER